MRYWLEQLCLVAAALATAVVAPPATARVDAPTATSNVAQPVGDIDAWTAAKRMGVGVNIGNSLESTDGWETGWHNPPITKAYIDHLAALGFQTVRLPVAWDAYAHDGRIDRSKLDRVGEIVDWITSAGM